MNKTPNEIIDALISIKDWHKRDLMLSEIETINDACNFIKRLKLNVLTLMGELVTGFSFK